MQTTITVKLIGGSRARLMFYKYDVAGRLSVILDCDAFIGKNGLGKEKEGDMKTPVGDFSILYAFGIKPNPGTVLNYLSINNNHYACDEDCCFYNKIVDSSVEKHPCKGEHMASFIPQYNYGIVLDYNKDCIYPKGSAIFIHCNGSKGYTAGCISIKEEDMITILRNVDLNTKVSIFA